MKALSLWEPWASLWAHGHKKIETRSWPLRVSLPCVVAIHASKKWDATLRSQTTRPYYAGCLKEIGWVDLLNPPTLGCIIGLVRIVKCAGSVALVSRKAISEQEDAFGDYSPGRFGYVADKFFPAAVPIPSTGMLGLWTWKAPAEIEEIASRMLEKPT